MTSTECHLSPRVPWVTAERWGGDRRGGPGPGSPALRGLETEVRAAERTRAGGPARCHLSGGTVTGCALGPTPAHAGPRGSQNTVVSLFKWCFACHLWTLRAGVWGSQGYPRVPWLLQGLPRCLSPHSPSLRAPRSVPSSRRLQLTYSGPQLSRPCPAARTATPGGQHKLSGCLGFPETRAAGSRSGRLSSAPWRMWWRALEALSRALIKMAARTECASPAVCTGRTGLPRLWEGGPAPLQRRPGPGGTLGESSRPPELPPPLLSPPVSCCGGPGPGAPARAPGRPCTSVEGGGWRPQASVSPADSCN